MSVIAVSEAVSVDGRDGCTVTAYSQLNLQMSLPKALGGAEQAGTTSPEELFAATYASCFGGAIKLAASRQNREIPEPTVNAQVALNHSEEEDFFLTVKLNVKIGDLSRAETGELVKAAQRICPYSKAVNNNICVTFGE